MKTSKEPVKILYNFQVKLNTALHIGTGLDSPVGAAEILKNGKGEFFIPGTTIAGLFFDTLHCSEHLIAWPLDSTQGPGLYCRCFLLPPFL